MNDKKAKAKYNMSFDKGKFIKNKIYTYQINFNNSSQVLITTEEGYKQELYLDDFHTLFILLKN